jgi:hypothetical protein
MAHGTVTLFHLSLKSLDEAGDMGRIAMLIIALPCLQTIRLMEVFFTELFLDRRLGDRSL